MISSMSRRGNNGRKFLLIKKFVFWFLCAVGLTVILLFCMAGFSNAFDGWRQINTILLIVNLIFVIILLCHVSIYIERKINKD